MRFFFHWRKISVNEFVGEFNFPASLITVMICKKKPSGHQRLLFLSYVTLNCYVITSDYSRVSSRVTRKKHIL